MEEKDALLNKIERLRDELNQLVLEKNKIDHQEIIKKSRELDRLITEYTAKYSSK
ncbi:MAG TPA: aspartyl-phosphate phosphatase Spo0E family protein [Firmicutes bacterium]|jgi:hypothetical protein|nr:aspartyl-phosphate phosphatase Spo0E family protein [Bacillota bacterium]